MNESILLLPVIQLKIQEKCIKKLKRKSRMGSLYDGQSKMKATQQVIRQKTGFALIEHRRSNV